ncbi:hypothetical protein H696_03444 [Fonticula alba]|uniref:Mitochondrial import inner membrane translocase subunit TIM17 n=1 Tax=Fonticula alba TaxID=691883 RepID=A0A058Z6U0_FONAL|nr:hypothetical protein H696_03444 [Fonticula alba]KCV69979.1 hypothetical protein H696_03444 [Fonticula alba]|eukprot:XP_009495585.1 hypothetical protein H696_03444 [Fonticula alba]
MDRPDHGREPCPWRIGEDAGGAFAMGFVGSSMINSFKGFRNAPKSANRIAHALRTAQRVAPVTGGSFAVWGATFSTLECTFSYLRGKSDSYNMIAAGTLTGGILALRSGIRSAAISAVIGGSLMAVFEMISVALNRTTADMTRPTAFEFGVSSNLSPTVLDPHGPPQEFSEDKLY